MGTDNPEKTLKRPGSPLDHLKKEQPDRKRPKVNIDLAAHSEYNKDRRRVLNQESPKRPSRIQADKSSDRKISTDTGGTAKESELLPGDWKTRATGLKKIEAVKRLEQAKEGPLGYTPRIHHGVSRLKHRYLVEGILAGGEAYIIRVGRALGIADIKDKIALGTAAQSLTVALDNHTSNMHLGPLDEECSKPAGYWIDKNYVSLNPEYGIVEPRTWWHKCIEEIMLRSRIQKEMGKPAEETLIGEDELNVVYNCLVASQMYHLAVNAKKYHLDELAEKYYRAELKTNDSEIDQGYNKDEWIEKVEQLERKDFRRWLSFAEEINDDRIEENLCDWKKNREGKWRKRPAVLEEHDFHWRLWLAEKIDEIWPSINKEALDPDYLARQYWAMNCTKLPDLDLKSVKYLGGLSSEKVQDAINYIEQQLERKTLSAKQRAAMQEVIDKDGDPEKLTERRILRHCKNFFQILTHRDVRYLLKAWYEGPGEFTGRFSIWGERALDERLLSLEIAEEWEKGVTRQIANHPEKQKIRQKLAQLIKQDYPDVTNLRSSDYQQYVHDYIRSFVQLKNIEESPRRLVDEFLKRKGRFSKATEKELRINVEERNLLKRVLLQTVRSLPDKGESIGREIRHQIGYDNELDHFRSYIDGFIIIEGLKQTPRQLAAIIRKHEFKFPHESDDHPLCKTRLSGENSYRLSRAIYHDYKSLSSEKQREIDKWVQSTFGKTLKEHVKDLVNLMEREE